jgi:hypothetical protein
MAKVKHPLQPIIFDKHGVARFKKNKIVDFLLDWASQRGMDLNALAIMNFDKNERWQFAQLIGYSVSGIGDLSYHDRKDLETADLIVEQMVHDREVAKETRKAARAGKKPMRKIIRPTVVGTVSFEDAVAAAKKLK